MLQQGNTASDNLESIVPSYLVELSVLAMSGQDAIAEDMKNFSEQLKPYPFVLLNMETHSVMVSMLTCCAVDHVL